MDILFVCTGNICRSPAAAALLQHRVQRAGHVARVTSAGQLEDGRPASEHGVAILSLRGIDLSSHRSRRVTGDLLRSADLVVGMAREHVVAAAADGGPAVWQKAFTLKELVQRGNRVGPRQAGEPLEQWVARVHRGRNPQEFMRTPGVDVEDPIGQPRAAYERMMVELDGLIDQLVWLLWGEADDRVEREWAS